MNHDNEVKRTRKEEIEDAAGAVLFIAFAYVAWCLVAVL